MSDFKSSSAILTESTETHISNTDWLLTLIILSIPLVNIVMMFLWAFDRNIPKSKANFYKAYILFIFGVFVISMILVFSLGMFGWMAEAIRL